MNYHERQRWSLCGIHAVNNLLQEQRYTKATFDAVCEELDPSNKYWNAHRSALGIGNYDVNVLMVVCEQQEGMHVEWHDERQEITPDVLVEKYQAQQRENSNDKGERLFGIVVNLPSSGLWGKLTKGRHWLTLRWSFSEQHWVNLDSELAKPQIIGDMEACAKLLQGWCAKQTSRGDNCHVLFAWK